LTATDGGGQAFNALTTSGTGTGTYERFTVVPSGSGYQSFVTENGYYVSVNPGVTSGPYVTQTTGTAASDATLLKPQDAHAYGGYTLETYYDYFLYFSAGPGQSTNAIGTNYGSLPQDYYVVVYPQQCGDLGSGYKYRISFADGEYDGVPNYFEGMLQAINGGGLASSPIYEDYEDDASTEFTFIQQPNGTYALQTSDGTNYVTAVDGGGLLGGNALATNRTVAQAWEQFVIKDIGSCEYTIQTVSGYYLASRIGAGNLLSTDISDPNKAPAIGYSPYFVLRPVWN
jgi:hypothetical protein